MALLIFAVIVVAGAAALAWLNLDYQARLDAMTPAERAAHEAEMARIFHEC